MLSMPLKRYFQSNRHPKISSFFDYAIRQAENLAKLALGRPVIFPSLVSATIDKDDVILARQWLRKPSAWYDPSIVADYEKAFATWNGSKYAFAFMGGRVALSACVEALGLKPGDEVIVPGYTCIVVSNAFQFAGVTTVYSDIELETYGLDANVLETVIGEKTKAILLHHLYGLVCRDYEKILAIATKFNLKIIEDCAHSTGAKFRNRNVGNFGDVAFYSSEQSKVFTTIQGGIAVTNDDVIAARIRRYVNKAPFPDEKTVEKQLTSVILNYYRFKHPQRWWLGDIVSLIHRNKRITSTTHEEECSIRPAHYGQKMPAPIASIGINQLKKIDRYNGLRRDNALRLDRWCDENHYEKPLVINKSEPVFLRYPVLVEPENKRDTSWVYKALGVQPGIWFESNIHPIERIVERCPNADIAVERCINFPCCS